MKNILVTGGAGFIGSHTVIELIENGLNPIIADDFRNSHKRIIEGLASITGKKIKVFEIDLCDRDSVEQLFADNQIDGVIHFAAYKAVGESVEDPLKYYRNNIVSLVNVLDASIEHGVGNFVFSSSCTVYGDPGSNCVVTEQSPIQPANSPYGSTKQICEQILEDTCKSGKSLKVLNLRYFNPVGAHESGLIGELPLGRPNNLFPIVTQAGVGKIEELTVNGNDYSTIDGTCVRDYVHVCDVASAHVDGLNWLNEQQSPVFENVNIGTGKGTSVLEIIHTFEKISDVKLNWKVGPRREGDVPEIYADVTKARELMNWTAQRDVTDALKSAWKWELNIKND